MKSFAYTINVDSLISVAEHSSIDTNKINVLITIGDELRRSNDNKAVQYLSEALNLSDSLSYIKGTIRAHYYMAYYYMEQKKYDQAIAHFDTVLNVQEKGKNEILLSETYVGKGTAYLYMGNFELAEKVFNAGVDISQNTNNANGRGDLLKQLGILFVYSGNYEKAVDYFKQAIIPYRFAENDARIGDCLTNIGVVYNYMGQHKKAVKYQKDAVKLYRSSNSRSVLATALNNLGVTYDDMNMYADALEQYTEALVIRIELGEPRGISTCYNNIGEVYRDQGIYAKALEYYEKSLSIDKEENDDEGIAICLLNIGGIHFTQGNFEKAHKYYGESLEKANGFGDDRIVANVLNAIGEILLTQNKNEQAMSRLEQALSLSIKLGDKSEEARSEFLMGEVYNHTNELASAIEKYNKALLIHIELDEEGEASTDRIKIGEAWFKMGYISKSITYCSQGLASAERLGVIDNIRLAAEVLNKAYAHKKDYGQAYKYAELFKEMHDSIFTLESQKQIHIVENRFELERKEREIELQNTRLAKQEAEINQRRILQNTLIGGIVAIFLIGILVVISYVRIRKAKSIITLQKDQIEEKNEELKQGNEELRVTVETVNAQKTQIIKTTSELKDSIYYAQYIQKAILPKKETLEKQFADHFILYRPKDIVSGDFYWTTELEGRTVIAAADCTGHGVPGAFMSMLGVSFLNDIVNKEYITHTGVILRKLRKEVIHALQQKGEMGEQRDGMDIALCSIDFKNMELQFSGAHNPLYIIRSKDNPPITEVNAIEFNDYILYEIKGDRMPISLYEIMNRFSHRDMNIYKGDLLYIFSDGYMDQFGGKTGKCFKSRRFKEVLLRNAALSMEDQKSALESVFAAWKGEYEQIDDVMVLGMRV